MQAEASCHLHWAWGNLVEAVFQGKTSHYLCQSWGHNLGGSYSAIWDQFCLCWACVHLARATRHIEAATAFLCFVDLWEIFGKSTAQVQVGYLFRGATGRGLGQRSEVRGVETWGNTKVGWVVLTRLSTDLAPNSISIPGYRVTLPPSPSVLTLKLVNSAIQLFLMCPWHFLSCCPCAGA